MTRAEFHAQQHGGTWRKSPIRMRCGGMPKGERCMTIIIPGEHCFNTNTPEVPPSCHCVKIHLCAVCASEEHQ